MVASQNGHTKTVLLLLQNGVHINMQDNDGWTSLMFASLNGHTETVLLLAMATQQREIVELLLEYGAA